MVKGKNPCFTTLVDLPSFCLIQPLPTSLMLQLVVGAVITEVVVVVVGCQPYPLAHSTHVCPFFTLAHSSLVSSLSPRFWLFASHAEVLGAFLVSRRHFLGAPRVAEAPMHCNSRPYCCFVHPQAKSDLFSPHAGPLLLCILTHWGFPLIFAFTHWILPDLPTQQFSSADLWIVWSYPSLMGRLWVLHCCSRSPTGWETVIYSPKRFVYVFLMISLPRTGCVFPRCWLWLLWSSLHAGNCCKFE